MNNIEDMKDKELVTINQIRNISFIKIYDIASFELDDSRKYTLPAMMINYDGNKFLNLSAKDKHFDQFVRKVQQVYIKENPTARVDKSYSPFAGDGIDIDPVSKKILLSGNLQRENEIYDFYNDKKFYDRSLLYDKDDMKLILPILKHNFKEFMEKAGILINYQEDSRLVGYRENYSMDAKVKGFEDKLLFEFSKDDSSYSVVVRSNEHIFPDTKVKIIINTDAIHIESEMIGKETNSEVIYELINNPSVQRITYINGIMAEYNRVPIAKSENPNIPLQLLSGFDGDWYELPWGDWYGIKESVERVDDFEIVATRDSKFLSIDDDGFLLHDDYRKKWVKEKGINTVESSMILDDIKKTVKCKRLDDDTFLLETQFIDRASTTDGKYFYHVTQSKKTGEITKESLASISRDNNVIYSGDLYDKSCIHDALEKRLNYGNNQ